VTLNSLNLIFTGFSRSQPRVPFAYFPSGSRTGGKKHTITTKQINWKRKQAANPHPVRESETWRKSGKERTNK